MATRKALLSLMRWILVLVIFVWIVERIQLRDLASSIDAPGSLAGVGRLQKQEPTRAVFTLEDGRRLELERLSGGNAPGKTGLVWAEAGTGRLWSIQMGFLSRLDHIDWFLLVFAAAGYFFSQSFPGARWHWLLHTAGLHLGLLEACRLNWIGLFFNNAIPGTTGGDVVKAYYAMQATEYKSIPILTIVMDRLLGLFALLLLAALILPASSDRFRELNWGVLVAVLVMGLSGIVFLSIPVWNYIQRQGLFERLIGTQHLSHVGKALNFYRTQKMLLLFWLGASMVNHALYAVFTGILGQAMGFEVPLVDYLTISPLVSLASGLSITPSGWGVGEALFDLLFIKFAGQSRGDGAAFSILAHSLTVVLSLTGGIFYLCRKGQQTHKQEEASLLLKG